ncbi:MAG: response regulator transcription factor [Bacteroidales bacterium]|nr:response regulator transcription factor [Bacteroidales bacterium]MDD6852316.1 response regulator transcription factor [Bacteroidales bacterium]MDY2931935.1 response regulator transcription factor [Muribaculaceae bacterium]
MEGKQRILVVDDENDICEVIKLNLELNGYAVDTASTAEEALKKDLSQFSLLLLDVMMGEMSGYELTKKIREDNKFASLPIILCTAKDQESDVETGFLSGADDYIKKPFSMKELILRVQSLLRRCQNSQQQKNILSYQGLIIDRNMKSCEVDGVNVPLTKKEFDILELFLSSPEIIFSREEILDKVWEEDVLVIDRTIDVNINRLRKKLGEYGKNIITKSGYGYGFKQ